jgi:UDP-GlcNAc:undecaprenyl-phosphate/decaprenyl-phosphate GlcNAc-1-phosphate transferase
MATGASSATVVSAVSLVTAAVLGFGMRWIAPRVRGLDHPAGQMKPHASAVPFLGGLAVAGAIAAGLATKGWPLPWPATAAISGALALGLADDYLDVPPIARLGAQVGLGMVLAIGGLTAAALPATAVAWIVGAVGFAAALNAVNMVDGLDGLAGGTVAISALVLALVAARAGHDGPMVLALVTAGATVGFLAHNLPPARLFLGDNGAYLLAAALAVIVLGEGRTVAALLGAATCFGLFGLDLLLAILRRAMRGGRLTTGDRAHLYDQLQERGVSHWRTLVVCWAVHLAIVLAGVQAARLATAPAVATVAAVWILAIVWLVWSGFVTDEGDRP